MATVSKEEYLKKYLSVNAEEKKKKKRRKVHGHVAKVPKSRIVDDDIDLKSLLPANLANSLEEDVGDNDPTVAEFIDERPEDVKQLEKFRASNAWKTLGDDGNQSDEEPRRKQRHDSDSDQSPARKQRHDSDSDQSPARKQRHDSDSDQSPSRRQRHDSDSDQSPARRRKHDSNLDKSAPRKQSKNASSEKHVRKSRFSDIDKVDISRKGQTKSDLDDIDSDQSPPRQQRHDSDSDQSPPRKSRYHNSHVEHSRRPRHGSDSDQSPPRRRRNGSDSHQSQPRRRRNGSDSNQSPPRKRRPGSDSDQSPPRKRRPGSDSDQSPPRKRRPGSDSDQSPPRRGRAGADSHKDKNNKVEKTLGGKKAGLSSAKQMRLEADELKRKENANFRKISDDRLGRGAATVFRDKSGKRRNLAEERRIESEEAKKKEKEDEKFKTWGKGLKQIEEKSKQLEDALHEVNKPLARYKDDEDLDQMMKEMDRAEDPMLAFIKKKKKNSAPVKEKPKYKGPAPPPNRFGILPGYRWDGVNRSNGFEKQIFTKQAERTATADVAYKWSVEDM